MKLRWLELVDFRSYSRLRWEPADGVNVVAGDNGAGKTNLLEAVAYLSSLRSFRRSPDAALARLGAAAAVVRGEWERTSGPVLVEVEIPAQGRRRVQVNGKRPARLRTVAAELPLVTFLPDDLQLVKGGPSMRREYLDDLAVQIWPAAGGEQDDYERSVRQRNALLREAGPHVVPAELDVWDARVSETGAAVVARRYGLLDALRPGLADAYREVAGEEEILTVSYLSAIEPLESLDTVAIARKLLDRLGERRRLDTERRVTTVGPHRDDVRVEIADRDARTMASQGEQRSAALAMRLAAYDRVGQGPHGAPVLVLDDVFSELDARRAAAVVRRLPHGQVLVSTARGEDVPVRGARWRVENGAVIAS